MNKKIFFTKDQIEKLKKDCLTAPIENEFPDRMPLLQGFKKGNNISDKYLEETSVLFIQHHLYPFIGRLDVMTEDGLSKEKTWIIDIPYSSINRVIEKVNSKYTINENQQPSNKSMKPLDNYADFQLDRTKKVISNIIKTIPNRLLVIDDGAYFIRALHELFKKEPKTVETLRDKLYVVEQTTRGLRYLEDDKYKSLGEHLNIPIVSIAKSNTKEYLESPFIGVSCERALKMNKRVNKKLKKAKDFKIGVIGYGAVGKAVFNSIKNSFKLKHQIDVIEIDETKWDAIRKNGGDPKSDLSDDCGNKYYMLFGCTGERSFTWKDRDKICKNGVLISCSSAAVEFSRREFIDKAELLPNDPITLEPHEKAKADKKDDIHLDLVFRDKKLKQKFYFLNSCYPINFTGFETIPRKFIEPTHALMYAASYQVLKQPPIKGLQELNEDYDNWIHENAFKFN